MYYCLTLLEFTPFLLLSRLGVRIHQIPVLRSPSIRMCHSAMLSHSVVSNSLQTPWTIAHQAPLSMELSRQQYWSGLLYPSPDLPNPGVEPRSLALQADSLLSEEQGSPRKLEWVAYPFSRGSSRPTNQTRVSCIAGGFFTS